MLSFGSVLCILGLLTLVNLKFKRNVIKIIQDHLLDLYNRYSLTSTKGPPINYSNDIEMKLHRRARSLPEGIESENVERMYACINREIQSEIDSGSNLSNDSSMYTKMNCKTALSNNTKITKHKRAYTTVGIVQF